MKTRKTIFIAALFISVIQCKSQVTTKACMSERVITLTNNIQSIGGVVFVDESKTYVFKPGLTAVFQPEWEYSNLGRLVAFKSDVDCIVYSKENPESGWSMLIPKKELINFKSGSQIDEIIVLESIRFIDNKNGWAIAKIMTNNNETAIILHTDDGGKSWIIQYVGGSALELNATCFQNETDGTITGNRKIGSSLFSVVLNTKDGGSTWEEFNLNSVYPK